MSLKRNDKPDTVIHPNKIRQLPFLLNAINEEHADLKIPKHAMLIGAGCSYNCGIPLGNGIVELCKLFAFLKEHVTNSKQIIDKCKYNIKDYHEELSEKRLNKDFENFIEKKEKILASQVETLKENHIERLGVFLKGEGRWENKEKEEEVWNNYKDSIIGDGSYGFWMNQLSEGEEGRQRFIESLIDNIQPDGAYIILSYLIEKRKFTNILTTNFDDLINEAVMYYTSQRCRFYVDDELSQYISVHSKKPNIIKLHGDYRFANMKNTPEETEKLTDNLSRKLKEILNTLGLIVAGYNGADYSIMSVLQDFKKNYKYPLIWCDLDAKNVHWRVAHLINKTENSFFVEIKGFDWLMGQLAIHFLSNVPDIVEKAKEKKRVIDDFLRTFAERFNEESKDQAEVILLDRIMDKWKRLQEADERRDYKAIIDIETKTIEEGKPDERDFYNRGYAYAELNNHEKALEDYDMALKINPNLTFAYNNRGNTLRNLNQIENAIACFDKAIELDPNFAFAYNNRGNIYMDLEQFDNAINDFNKAIELDSAYWNAYNSRGNVYCKKGNYEQALENYNEALIINETDPVTYNNRGVAYFKMQKYEQAIRDYNKAIELDPNYAITHSNLGEILFEKGEIEKAIACYDKAIELDSSLSDAYEGRAQVYAKLGDLQKASIDQEKAKELKEKQKNRNASAL